MGLLSLAQVTRCRADGRRSVAVLDAVSMDVEAGDFVGVWGPRRSGKSTLLRVLAGIESPDNGEVRFDGHVLNGMSARRRAKLLRHGGVALVKAQGGGPVPNHHSVWEVALGALCDGLSLREGELHARRVLGEVGVGECADMKLGALTLGERVRVALAGALIREPRVLLVDEPAVLSSLRESSELFLLLRSIGEGRGRALVIASEELDPLQGASRTFSISAGAVREMGSGGVVLPFPEPRGKGAAGHRERS